MNEDERIERFEAAYNRIDRALTDLVAKGGGRRKHGFSAKVRIAANRMRRFARHADFLLEAGELRNAVVHNRTGDDLFLAVPSERTVLEMERIEQSLFAPERVVPRFERPVVTLRPDQSLADAWDLIRDDGYSRYPVYDEDGFVGLLTSNGFARWCAARMKGHMLEVDASRVRISDVLEADHRRQAVEFVSRNALVDDVDHLFSERKPLEAVIITKNGRREEPPLGMVCPADVAEL
ncbi:MAG: CBS domain-containing protein [Planctomycetota bacterium]|jgi:predicted transcriptional regulator